MATKKDDSLQSVSVRFDRKNYLYWSYVMKNFLKGKKIWGYSHALTKCWFVVTLPLFLSNVYLISKIILNLAYVG
jgi:hypothetical protein